MANTDPPEDSDAPSPEVPASDTPSEHEATQSRTLPHELRDEHIAGMRWVEESGLFTLDASRDMYAGVQRLHPAQPGTEPTTEPSLLSVMDSLYVPGLEKVDFDPSRSADMPRSVDLDDGC